jgi:hypothetical protein
LGFDISISILLNENIDINTDIAILHKLTVCCSYLVGEINRNYMADDSSSLSPVFCLCQFLPAGCIYQPPPVRLRNTAGIWIWFFKFDKLTYTIHFI